MKVAAGRVKRLAQVTVTPLVALDPPCTLAVTFSESGVFATCARIVLPFEVRLRLIVLDLPAAILYFAPARTVVVVLVTVLLPFFTLTVTDCTRSTVPEQACSYRSASPARSIR